MRFRVFNYSLNAVLAFTIFLVMLTIATASAIFYWDFSNALNTTRNKNIEIQEANDEFLILSESKLRLSKVINEVDQTIISLNQYVLDRNAQLEFDRNKIWDRTVFPEIAEIEEKLDGIEDKDFRVRFNVLYDHVLNIKHLQDEIVNAKSEELRLQYNEQLSELSNKTTNLFNSLVSAQEGKRLSVYKEVDYFNESRLLIVSLFMAVVIICILLYSSAKSTIGIAFRNLEKVLVVLKEGNIPEEINSEFIDTNKLVRSINHVIRRFNKIKTLATQIGDGEFQSKDQVQFKDDGVVGTSLRHMQSTVSRVAEEDEKRNRINEGLAKFSEILGNYTNDLQRFGDEVILNLVHFLKANQGAFFVVNKEDDDQYMELLSAYAYNKKKFISGKIKPGQGLVGQAWLEEKRIYMTDVPKNYVNVTSGLGYSTPRCILIIPLLFNDEVHGILELASFSTLQSYELAFVEKVSENIASALSSVKVNSRTQELLNQYEALNEKMAAHDKRMSDKVSELNTIQEESIVREEQYVLEIKRLKKRLSEYELHL